MSPSVRQSVELQVGELIDDKYQLVRLIGIGGMGSVYEARHVEIGRRAALKFLKPQILDNAEMVTRFLREARAASSIDSDHIVDITDVGSLDDDSPYLVMEYLEGENLEMICRREGMLEPTRAVDFCLQICEGLEKAHLKGIVHRDIKPGNLFVTTLAGRGDWVKVLDFGIAKLRAEVTDSPNSLTGTGVALGTPFYMAPEQFRGARDVDGRSDIYSTGVILYEMLTGQLPFKGESLAEVVLEVATGTARPPHAVRPSLNKNLSDIVTQAMAREPDDRFLTMKALAEALRPFGGDGQRGRSKPREEHSRDQAVVGANIEIIGAPPGSTSPLLGVNIKKPLSDDAGDDRESKGENLSPPQQRGSPPNGDFARPEEDAAPEAAKDDVDPSTSVRTTDDPSLQESIGRKSEMVATMPMSPGAPLASEGQTIDPAHPLTAQDPQLWSDIVATPTRSRSKRFAMVFLGLGGGAALVVAAIAVVIGYSDGETPVEAADRDVARTVLEAPHPNDLPEKLIEPPAKTVAREQPNHWIQLDPATAGTLLGLPSKAATKEALGFRPERAVTAPTYAYEIQQHEVTWGELLPWLNDQSAHDVDQPTWLPEGSRDRYPATAVPWSTAMAYCRSLGASLPTEEEWEYAARGQELRPNPWGTGPLDLSRTHVYRQGQPLSPAMSSSQDVTPGDSSRALFDLVGNAQEWTANLFRLDSPDPADDEAWVQQGGRSYRTVRGLPPSSQPPSKFPSYGLAYRDALCATGQCATSAETQAQYQKVLEYVGFRCARRADASQ